MQDRPASGTASHSPWVSIFSFRNFDPSVLDRSAGMVGDKPRHFQIGRGPLHGQADQILLDRCALRIGSLSQTVRVQVQFPGDRATLAVALDAVEPIRLHGKSFTPDNLTVFGPGEEIDALFSPGARWVTFYLPIEDYELELGTVSENPDLPRPRGIPRFLPSPWSMAQLQGALASVEELVRNFPGLFVDAQWRFNIERALRNGFFGALDDGTMLQRGAREARLTSAWRVVRDAEALLDKEDAALPSIASLCRKLRVSRRTLQRSFQELLGMGPSTYFRIRALNAVRRALAAAPPHPGVVARLAVDHGFWHLGRFAQHYRELFGERPSDTLRASKSGASELKFG
jgi:AraC family ethanolamine operon transcriptional activator